MKDIITSRKIDELGRVVLPIEARQALDLNQDDLISILWNRDQQTVLLQKYKLSCLCCQSTEKLKSLPNGKYICAACLQDYADV